MKLFLEEHLLVMVSLLLLLLLSGQMLQGQSGVVWVCFAWVGLAHECHKMLVVLFSGSETGVGAAC